MRARTDRYRGARSSIGRWLFILAPFTLLMFGCDDGPTAPGACVGNCAQGDGAREVPANEGDAGAPPAAEGEGTPGRTFAGPGVIDQLPEGSSPGAALPSAGDFLPGGAAHGGSMSGDGADDGAEDGPVEPGGRGGDGTGTGAGDDPVNPGDDPSDHPGGEAGMPPASCPPAWDPGLMSWLVTREGIDGLVLDGGARTVDEVRRAHVPTGDDAAPGLRLRRIRVLADGLRAVAIGTDTEDVQRNNALHLVNLARGVFIDVVPWRSGVQGIVLPEGDDPVELAGLAVTPDGRHAFTWWHLDDETSALAAADLAVSEPVDLVGDGSMSLVLPRIADVAVDRAGRIYVAHRDLSALSILSLDTTQPVQELPVDVGGGDNPIRVIAPAYDGRTVYLALGRNVARLDIEALLADEDPDLLFLDARPHGRYSGEVIALSPSASSPDEVFAVVRSDWGLDRADRYRVDVAAVTVDGLRVRWRLALRTGDVPDRSGWSVAAAADGETLYVARNNSGEVTGVDVETGEILAAVDHAFPVRDLQVASVGDVDLDEALGEACVAPGKTAFGHTLPRPADETRGGDDGLGGDLEGVALAPGEGGAAKGGSRDAGCGCDVGVPGAPAPWLLLALAAGLAWTRRRFA